MNTTLGQRFGALLSAAFLTLVMLAGVNGLATGEPTDLRLVHSVATAHKA